MAFVLADRVRETTTTTGTGTVTLAGAVIGFQTFAAIGNGNNTYYAIAGQGTSEWEVGIGTYTAAGTLLSRDTVLASSNSGSLVNFSAGTKDVFCDYPAGRAVYLDATNNVSTLGTVTSGTWQGSTVGVAYGGTGLTTFTGANRALYSLSSSALTAGTLPVAAGGTGATTLTGYVKGSGTFAFTSVATIPNSDTTATSTNSGNTIVARDGTGGCAVGAFTATSLSITNGTVNVTNTTNIILFGGNTATGAMTFGRSTDSQTTNIQAGATVPGATKTINFGTNGQSGSTTTIAIGSTFGTSVTANGSWTYSGGTANGVAYLDASKVLTTGSAFAFDGSTVSAPQVRSSNGIVVNSQTVSTNYTIASGDNGLSAGPVTVASGIIVTVSSGSVWTVV